MKDYQWRKRRNGVEPPSFAYLADDPTQTRRNFNQKSIRPLGCQRLWWKNDDISATHVLSRRMRRGALCGRHQRCLPVTRKACDFFTIADRSLEFNSFSGICICIGSCICSYLLTGLRESEDKMTKWQCDKRNCSDGCLLIHRISRRDSAMSWSTLTGWELEVADQ
jgi:hypothetical protein